MVVESKDNNIRDNVTTSSLLLKKKINILLMNLPLLFLSKIIEKEKKEKEEKKKVGSPNNVSKDIMWNTLLTISNDFVKIKGVLGINY